METEYMEFLEATADSTCTCASEFNNRAIALMELGRYDEAQRDFERACSLEPDPSYFLNAAELYLALRMEERALENVRKARQLAGNGHVTHPQGLYHVACMFLKCNEPKSAEEVLLAFLQFLQSIIPYTLQDEMGGYIVRKDGHTIHATPFIIDFDDLDRLIGAIYGARGRNSTTRQIKKLYEEARVGISSIRMYIKKL